MARPRRSAVQKYHDRVAGRYDESYDDEFWQWHDGLTWDYLKPFLPRDMSAPVLDLGCGTGKWGAKLVKSGYRVTFVDISAPMLDQARRKIAEMGTEARAEFVHADLCNLSALPRTAFSLAVAFGDPIGCSTSPPQAMKEIHKLLDDRGVLVATFDNRLAALEFYLDKGDPSVLKRFLRDGRTHWLTKGHDERFPIHTYGPRELCHLVESTGFALIEMVGKTVLPMRGHRELLADAAARREWAAIEKSLAREAAALARASHLQIACRVARKGGVEATPHQSTAPPSPSLGIMDDRSPP